MTDIVKAVVLGIVEGLTEFLPVSSTGHLILVNEFVDFRGSFARIFDIVIQLGAILSVVVYYRKALFPFFAGQTDRERKKIWDLWKKIIVGVFPALVFGATLGKHIEEYLFNPATVALALLIGGIALILLERRKEQGHIPSIAAMNYKTAFCIGIIQCLAMIPGTSRSAATIIGAMLLGLSRVSAAEFSFFLAIPTLFAASAYSLMKTNFSFSWLQIQLLSVGFIISFIVAWFVIAGFMKFIKNRDFKLFGYYRIVLAVLVSVYFVWLR